MTWKKDTPTGTGRDESCQGGTRTHRVRINSPAPAPGGAPGIECCEEDSNPRPSLYESAALAN